jgi:hypothetical protein
VTFIAAKDDTFGTKGMPPPTDQDGNVPADPSFLNTVREKLLSCKTRAEPVGLPSQGIDTLNPPRHMLVQVSSLRDIGKWFSEYFPDDDKQRMKLRVQFVGHSVSGRLSLGASWEPDKTKWYGDPFLVLDSNPRPLEELGLYVL